MHKTLTPEQIALLKKPLPKEAVKPHPTKTFLSSIKAIYVVERLNDVFGLGGWSAENEVVKQEGKMVIVKSTFTAPEYGIRIPDIFGGNDNADLGDAYKGACTDALTKIGSYLYIGMDVYKGLSGETKTEAPKKKTISTTQFDQALKRISEGETELIQKIKDTYQLDKLQFDTLNKITNKLTANVN